MAFEGREKREFNVGHLVGGVGSGLRRRDEGFGVRRERAILQRCLWSLSSVERSDRA